MRVLIMAQGRQERLSSLTIPKQALLVGGEPILGRTLRLLQDHARKAIVIGPQSLLEITAAHGAALITLSNPGYCILDGLYQTLPLVGGSDEILVLLGDTVFSKKALAAIVQRTERLRSAPAGTDFFFAGTSDLTNSTGELYAFALRPTMYFFFRDKIEQAPCRRAAVVDKGQPGHLRHLLRAFGYRVDQNLVEAGLENGVYEPVDDWTKDIDTEKDLAELLPKLDARVRGEA
jgi:hypothetical protein